MATTQLTPTTVAAMRKVFSLLEDNFDPTAGRYLHEYSDARIAKETNISEDAVKKYRTDGFGKLKPPSELQIAINDLRELEGLFLRYESEVKDKLKDLQARIRNLQKRFD